MSSRTWLYGKLSDPSWINLRAMVGYRIFAKKSMKSSVEDHPYIVFKLGNDSNANLAETMDVHTQFFQIWVHDFSDSDTGDYQQIDDIIQELKNELINASSPENGILSVSFLETSQDLNDETLGTVLRYIRLQMIIKEPS